MASHSQFVGNPFNAWVIYFQNKGPYQDALYGVGLDFYDSSGNVIQINYSTLSRTTR